MWKTSLLLLSAALPVFGFEANPLEIGKRPESITRGFGGDFFISVMEAKEPGDAVIKRLTPEGKISVFAKGFDEPKGLAFVGNHLVVSDLTRVWKIDSAGKASVLAAAKDFPTAPLYLNDVVAVPGEEAVYVTDMGSRELMMDQGKFWPLDSKEADLIPAHSVIYQITLEGKVTLAVPGSKLMRNTNGVGIGKDGQILIGGFFTGNLLEYREGKLAVIAEGFRGADAVEQDEDGIYYLSSWTQGKVWSYDAEKKETKVLLEGLKSAADFYFDKKERKIYCPDMLSGNLHVIEL